MIKKSYKRMISVCYDAVSDVHNVFCFRQPEPSFRMENPRKKSSLVGYKPFISPKKL